LSLVQKGDVVLHLGAGSGLESCYMGLKVGMTGKVVAIDMNFDRFK